MQLQDDQNLGLKCLKCEICGKPIEGGKFCIPFPVGNAQGKSDLCWCLCESCSNDQINRSQRILERKD